MFRRREKRHVIRRLGNLLWPEIGFRRWIKYVGHRLARLPGTPYSIAAGFACGAAVSMTPFVGLHFVLAALLSWFISANVVAGLIGTAVGNPWTFPFIWVWIFDLGNWILQSDRVAPGTRDIDFSSLFGTMLEQTLKLNFDYIFNHAWPLFWPMIVGGFLTAIVIWPLVYFPLRRLIAAYQHRRVMRRMQRRSKASSAVREEFRR